MGRSARERRALDVTRKALRQRFLSVRSELQDVLLRFETPDLDQVAAALDKSEKRYEADDVAAAFSRDQLDAMRDSLAVLRRATRKAQDYISRNDSERTLNLIVAGFYVDGVSKLADVFDMTNDPAQATELRSIRAQLIAAHDALTQVFPAATPIELTAVELDILRAMQLGLSNQAIADEQGRTVNTIRTHVSSILRKLGAGSRSEAIVKARSRGLI